MSPQNDNTNPDPLESCFMKIVIVSVSIAFAGGIIWVILGFLGIVP